MLTENYLDILCSDLKRISAEEKKNIMKAAEMVRGTIEDDGLVYVFGCGHSHMLSEETFYRAGGLACVCPVFLEKLMLHESASLSSKLEKQDGLYAEVLSGYPIGTGDTVIVLSTSGVNSVPVEFAKAVHDMGVKLVGITSYAYDTQTPHNPQNAHMKDFCDVVIDNLAPHGDACLDIEGIDQKMAPVSTVTGAFIINSILAEGAEMAAKDGYTVPVFLSGNIPGGSEFNRALVEKYSKRVKHL